MALGRGDFPGTSTLAERQSRDRSPPWQLYPEERVKELEQRRLGAHSVTRGAGLQGYAHVAANASAAAIANANAAAVLVVIRNGD